MAKAGTLTERTAINDYTLDGTTVRKGQVVPLTAVQIKSLATAGCVALTDADDADVPKADLPPLQNVSGPLEIDAMTQAVGKAREQAKVDLLEINRSVEDGRAKAQIEATDLEQGLVGRRRLAAEEIARIETDVNAARAEGEKEIAAIQARVQAAKDAASAGDTSPSGTLQLDAAKADAKTGK